MTDSELHPLHIERQIKFWKNSYRFVYILAIWQTENTLFYANENPFFCFGKIFSYLL